VREYRAPVIRLAASVKIEYFVRVVERLISPLESTDPSVSRWCYIITNAIA